MDPAHAEDYWLRDRVLLTPLLDIYNWLMSVDMPVLRFDLSLDRASKKHARQFPAPVRPKNTVIETPPNSAYQMSYQAGLWNVDLMLKFLVKNEDPWKSEIEGSKRLKGRRDIIILGSTLRIMNYRPVYRSKKSKLDLSSLPYEVKDLIYKKGAI